MMGVETATVEYFGSRTVVQRACVDAFNRADEYRKRKGDGKQLVNGCEKREIYTV